MSCGKKAAAQIALLITGIAMLCFGVWRGEAATLLTNLHLPNFLKGGLYQGAGKTV